VDVPQQVGQEDQEGGKAAQPDPFIEEHAALFGEQQAHDDSQAEDGDGILFFHADPGDHAEPQPVPRIIPLDGQNGEVSAAHPQIGFKAVGAEQTAVRKILRHDDGADGAEQHGEAASTEFPGQDGRLHYQQRRCQGRDEANAAQRVAQHGPAKMDQEGNERRLVDISPLQVVAARHVIELIAKVAVAVVEVNMEQQLG